MNMKVVFVMLNDCLISIKSGNQRPINIGDFMPDYNLWYALKFMQPSIIIILDTPDISQEYPSTAHFTAKISFVAKWLSQVTGVSNVYTSYSVDGTWRSYLYPESSDILMTVGARGYKSAEYKVFIDNLGRTSEDYIKNFHSSVEYLDKTEFIKVYNKNPRVYEKKVENQCNSTTGFIPRILGGPKPIRKSIGKNNQ